MAFVSSSACANRSALLKQIKVNRFREVDQNMLLSTSNMSKPALRSVSPSASHVVAGPVELKPKLVPEAWLKQWGVNSISNRSTGRNMGKWVIAIYYCCNISTNDVHISAKHLVQSSLSCPSGFLLSHSCSLTCLLACLHTIRYISFRDISPCCFASCSLLW